MALNRRDLPSRTTGTSPRWIVLGFLMASFAWAPIIAMSFTAPPTVSLTAVFVGGLAVFGFALLLVLVDAVDPGCVPAAGIRNTVLLIAVSLVLWAPSYSWAEPGEQPWAWLAGFAVAASALASWRGGVAATVVLVSAAGVGGAAFEGSPIPSVVTSLGCAVAVWAMCQVLVWVHRLWLAAQDGREAQAELAVAEERLRADRELHDVLGRRLAVIALKAELAAGFAAGDPERAAVESNSIRDLANGTLREARRAIHGETATDLPTQLQSADLVLGSAGIRTTIDADPKALALVPASLAALLATVIREAVTNVLRHSEARSASIVISATTSLVTLRVVNDGVSRSLPAHDTDGTGIAALSARCAAVGATLVAGRSGEDCFELRLESREDLGRPS
ncbi:histidine kinase [Micromonospora sp. NPDC050495]|uniref:sensor histidine kinase n=1 Tax=Micromonospora sp. NPDC050495 TaxID=3154936 RepID=UPI0033D9112A